MILLSFIAYPDLFEGTSGINTSKLKQIGLYPFVYPVMTPRLSSSYGPRKHPLLKYSRKHKGVDLAADIGAPVRVVAPGTVVFADPYAGYGNFVVVEHNLGVTTHYGHCDEIKVKPGQKVNAGDIIATIGNTGLSSGPHLHFELRINGEPKNPENFIPDLASHPEG
jgi:murein DD-endopeptidase MepM/ murein hydrolase activator NlpD